MGEDWLKKGEDGLEEGEDGLKERNVEDGLEESFIESCKSAEMDL